jgi:hypothetical protein
MLPTAPDTISGSVEADARRLLPWEEEFLKAGPGDPLALPMTDLGKVPPETPDSQHPSF